MFYVTFFYINNDKSFNTHKYYIEFWMTFSYMISWAGHALWVKSITFGQINTKQPTFITLFY